MSRRCRRRSGVSTRVGRLVLPLVIVSLIAATAALAAEGQKWPGVDESVVERVAKEHGREATRPFIDTDRGDLLLFVFLAAGAVGGFAAGYYWRKLVERRPVMPQREK